MKKSILEKFVFELFVCNIISVNNIEVFHLAMLLKTQDFVAVRVLKQ